MINILYMINYVAKPGGAEVSLLQILRNIDRTRFNPLLWTYAEGTLAQRVRSLGVEIIISPLPYINRTRNPILLIRYFTQLILKTIDMLKVFTKYKVDIVHVSDINSVIFASLASKLKNIRCIWHIRTVISNLGLVGDVLFSLVDKVIFVSEYQRRKALENVWKWSRNKAIVVYNGVDISEFDKPVDRSKTKAELGTAERSTVIGTAGRITVGKRYEDIIAAAKVILQKERDIQFIIVGDISHFNSECLKRDKRYLEQLKLNVVNSGIKDKVKFLGYRNDIAQIMKAMDLFVFPSTVDSFGRVVIEAMASGTGVIAAKSGAVLEIIKDGWNGVIVPPKNPTALAGAILNLLKDRAKLEYLIKNAQADVAERFNFSKIIKTLYEVYEDLYKF